MNPFELLWREDILLSTRLVVVADVLCGLGILAALVSALFHARPSADGTHPSWVARGPILFLILAAATMAIGVGRRWKEVNHFRCQTMSEVLGMMRTQACVEFVQLFRPEEGRMGVTVTFIAVLELLREGLVEIVQSEPYAPIHVRAGAPRRASLDGEFEGPGEAQQTQEP